jgi:hypothetical protein
MDKDPLLEDVASVRNREGVEGSVPEDLASARIPGVGVRILLPAEMIFETTDMLPVPRAASGIPVEQPQAENDQVDSDHARQD